MRRPSPSLLARAAIALIAGAGCATPKPPARDALAEARAAAHVYHRPAPEVAAAVQAELSKEGFALVPTDDGAFVHTQWKFLIDGAEFASTRVRYVVLVKRLTGAHCRVEAARITLNTVGMETYHPLSMSHRDGARSPTQNTANYGKGIVPLAAGPRSVGRDLAFEWRLLQRVDPAAARRIAADVERVTAAR